MGTLPVSSSSGLLRDARSGAIIEEPSGSPVHAALGAAAALVPRTVSPLDQSTVGFEEVFPGDEPTILDQDPVEQAALAATQSAVRGSAGGVPLAPVPAPIPTSIPAPVSGGVAVSRVSGVQEPNGAFTAPLAIPSPGSATLTVSVRNPGRSTAAASLPTPSAMPATRGATATTAMAAAAASSTSAAATATATPGSSAVSISDDFLGVDDRRRFSFTEQDPRMHPAMDGALDISLPHDADVFEVRNVHPDDALNGIFVHHPLGEWDPSDPATSALVRFGGAAGAGGGLGAGGGSVGGGGVGGSGGGNHGGLGGLGSSGTLSPLSGPLASNPASLSPLLAGLASSASAPSPTAFFLDTKDAIRSAMPSFATGRRLSGATASAAASALAGGGGMGGGGGGGSGGGGRGSPPPFVMVDGRMFREEDVQRALAAMHHQQQQHHHHHHNHSLHPPQRSRYLTNWSEGEVPRPMPRVGAPVPAALAAAGLPMPSRTKRARPEDPFADSL